MRHDVLDAAEKFDMAKLRALPDFDLDRRIDALHEVIAGIKSPEDSDGFRAAIGYINRYSSVDSALGAYGRAARVLRKEKRRRKLDPNHISPVAPWTPFRRIEIDMAQFATEAFVERCKGLAVNDPHGRSAEYYQQLYVSSALSDEHYSNSRYHVVARRTLVDDGEGGVTEMVHLSIKRHDQQPIHDWRDKQRIKSELIGAECEGVELYPAESRCVDTANQYHLWCVNSDTYRWPVGFDEGRVIMDEDTSGKFGGGQRAFEA